MHERARRWLEDIVRDVHYGLRALRRNPVLSLATILTFTLGIGINSGIFTMLNGMALRARVEKDPDTFAHVAAQYTGNVGRTVLEWGVSTDDFRAYETALQSLDHLAAWSIGRSTIGADDQDRTLVMPVTCNFFALYGLERPARGRLFRPEDCARPDGSAVVVVSETLWRTRFAAEANIVGSIMLLNHQPFTVIGVTPRGFAGQLRGPGVWMPYTMHRTFFGGLDFFRDRSVPWLTLEGRLRPGYTRASAQAELAVIARQQDGLAPGRVTTVTVTNGSLVQEPALRTQMLWIGPLILGAVLLILLLACTNVTMLALSRAVGRQREIGIRLAVGAGRARLVRMLLTESLMLAVVAGCISIWIDRRVAAVMEAFIPGMPHYPLQPDRLVFTYLAGITLLAGTIASLAPAAESLRVDLTSFINAHSELSGVSRGRLGGWLVSAQVAMSLVLLAGAGLFIRAEFTIFRADPGFNTRQVLLLSAMAPAPPAADATSIFQAVERRLQTLPAVQSVAVTSVAPFSSEDGRGPLEELHFPGQPAGSGLKAAVNLVSPSFFKTLGIAILRGRAFRDDDAAATVAATPIIISEALALRLWPDTDPLGQRLLDVNGAPLEVVGVARDVSSRRFGVVDGPSFYRVRAARAGGLLLVRFDGDPATAQLAVRNLLHEFDPAMRPRVETLQSAIDTFAARFWKLAEIVLVLGAVAIGLAAIGIYGVIAFAMSRRTREIGIRMAMGATRLDIVKAAIASGVPPVIVGLSVGLLLAIAGAAALQQAFRATPIGLNVRDPIAYATVVIALGIIALAAMLGPALRAGSFDPVRTLRHD